MTHTKPIQFFITITIYCLSMPYLKNLKYVIIVNMGRGFLTFKPPRDFRFPTEPRPESDNI